MHSKDFLLKDTSELELGIERHCVALGLDFSDEHQVRSFAHDLMRDMEQLKHAASEGDRTARFKVELFSMVLMLHDANTKAFGPGYMSQIEALSAKESAWAALAKALADELESRNPDGH